MARLAAPYKSAQGTAIHRRTARLLWYGVAAAAGSSLVCNLRGAAFVKGPSTGPVVAGVGAPAGSLAAATAAVVSAVPVEAWAKGGAWGALEGKTSSLVHPIIMPTLFLVTLYAGFLGWKWRETRLISGDLSTLRKQLPKDEDPEAEPSAEVMKLKAQIEEMTAQRAELIKEGFKDKHYQISSVILGGGVFFTIYGVFNTWFRTEKLFPGPHLFAGAAIVVIWAIAASLVPYMEKGNDTARTAHIGLNVVNLGLFAWQLPTGFEILQKVWGNANLPWF